MDNKWWSTIKFWLPSVFFNQDEDLENKVPKMFLVKIFALAL